MSKIEEFLNMRVLCCWRACGVFLLGMCRGRKINNSIQQPASAEPRFHTEGRLRIATTSLESFHCPKQFFPTENHFHLQLSHKDRHFDCYTARLAQKCSNFIIPLSFFTYLTCLSKLLWEWEILCAHSTSHRTSHVWGASFWVKSQQIHSVLEIIDELPTLIRELLVLHKANWRNNVTPHFKI